jgi:phosphoglucosamine mutase
MVQSGASLHELKAGMGKYPQSIINVPLSRKIDLTHCHSVQIAIRDVETQLGSRGRVLLRPSGTEPVVRVMVEGADATQVNSLAHGLATVVAEAFSV